MRTKPYFTAQGLTIFDCEALPARLLVYAPAPEREVLDKLRRIRAVTAPRPGWLAPMLLLHMMLGRCLEVQDRVTAPGRGVTYLYDTGLCT